MFVCGGAQPGLPWVRGPGLCGPHLWGVLPILTPSLPGVGGGGRGRDSAQRGRGSAQNEEEKVGSWEDLGDCADGVRAGAGPQPSGGERWSHTEC